MKFDNIFDALKWVTDKGGRKVTMGSSYIATTPKQRSDLNVI